MTLMRMEINEANQLNLKDLIALSGHLRSMILNLCAVNDSAKVFKFDQQKNLSAQIVF